jgi:hypothetical protein
LKHVYDRFVLPFQHICKTDNSLPKSLHELFIPKIKFNSRLITYRKDILKLVQKKQPLRSTSGVYIWSELQDFFCRPKQTLP